MSDDMYEVPGARLRELRDAALMPEEAKLLRLVACGFRGVPQGTMWPELIEKLKRIERAGEPRAH